MRVTHNKNRTSSGPQAVRRMDVNVDFPQKMKKCLYLTHCFDKNLLYKNFLKKLYNF